MLCTLPEFITQLVGHAEVAATDLTLYMKSSLIGDLSIAA